MRPATGQSVVTSAVPLWSECAGICSTFRLFAGTCCLDLLAIGAAGEEEDTRVGPTLAS